MSYYFPWLLCGLFGHNLSGIDASSAYQHGIGEINAYKILELQA